MTFLLILAAILLLGIMIIAHEYGHFISARMTGIAVQQFSIGFGPKLLKWKSKKYETEFMVRAIPVGGYCMYYAEDDVEGKQMDDPRAFHKQKVWKRMFSVLMGPGMNFLLAFVVAVLLFSIGGVQKQVPYIYSVDPAGPAAQAGFEPGDIFYSVNGQNVQDGTTETVVNLIGGYQAGNEPIQVTVLRGAKQESLTLTVTPFYDTAIQKSRIGVTISPISVPGKTYLSFGKAVKYSFDVCVNAGQIILGGLKDLIFHGQGLDQSAGPVGIVSQIAQQTRDYGLDGYLELLIILSINLGLVNLLPIPGLDGSRILFLLVEAIFRKPINRKAEAVIHLTGFALLITVMLFFTFKDIQRLFQ
jgi:regulator of sigma E protease